MAMYLVIDVGTTSMRGIVYDHTGEKVGNHRLKNTPIYKNHQVEQEVSDWEQGLQQIIEYFIANLTDFQTKLVGIFLTSQRSSLICLDHRGNPVRRALMWQDKRCVEVIDWLHEVNAQVKEITGSNLNPVYLAPKITWIKMHEPKVAQQTAKYISIADYLGYLITGSLTTDYTYASRTSLFDLDKQQWSQAMLELFNVQEDELCQLLPPGTKQSVSEPFRQKYGFVQNLTFISAGGDQQCSAVGMGVDQEGSFAVSLGTGGYILAPINQRSVADPRMIINSFPIGTEYMSEAIIPTTAAAINWTQKLLYNELTDEKFYELLTRTTTMPTDIYFMPHLQGRGTPDWNSQAKGAFIGLNLSTDRSEILKSVLESIGFELKNNILLMGASLPKIVHVGGGLSVNSALMQLYANILNVPVQVDDDSEATAYGAFIVGIKKLKQDSQLIEKTESTVFEPIQQAAKYYEKKRQEWNKYYSALQQSQNK